MFTILEQIFVLYAFLLLGWCFGRIKKDISDHTQVLSFLLVNLFLPAKVFGSFAKNFTTDYITKNYTTIFISTALLLISSLFSILIPPTINKMAKSSKRTTWPIVVPPFFTI